MTPPKQNDALKDLYPFLHDTPQNAAARHTALLNSVQQKAQASRQVNEAFFSDHAEILVAAAQTLAQCYANGGKLISMGNGGSSCDAAHVAVEFQHPVTAGRPSLPAFSLTTDMAFISAVANDVGVKHMFVRQIEAQAQKNDVLIGFSTSGNSDNLLAGFAKARQMTLKTIGFAGGDGGDMKAKAKLDHCLVVNTDSIHRVQETHVICYHILWDLTHTLLADSRGALSTRINANPDTKVSS